jgi:hypothetical protein
MRWRPMREAEALNRGKAERKICPPTHPGRHTFEQGAEKSFQHPACFSAQQLPTVSGSKPHIT